MITFLDETLNDILKTNNEQNLKNCIIVLPSRRAGLHFKKIVSNHINETVFLPKITTINEFIYSLSELTLINGFEAELELYSSYLKVNSAKETLDNFIHLAPLILNDFNQIDKYLLDANEFIFDLKSVNEIENWSLNESNLTENQLDYVEFWKNLGLLYNQFNNQLSKKGLSTEGNIYRKVANSINLDIIDHSKSFYFIGLNALSISEEKIISTHLKTNGSKAYFDGDSYYGNDKKHEAGFFYRKSAIFNSIKLPKHFDNFKKEINIYEVNNDVEQAQTVAAILEKENIKSPSCAIYLINEQVINPLLNNIPHNINSLNITMGYPINNTYTYAFLNEILTLFDKRNKKDFWSGNKLHYQFIEELFLLPLFKNSISKALKDTIYWKNKIKKNLKFIEINELINNFPEIENHLDFIHLKSIDKALDFIIYFSEYLSRIEKKINDKIEKECILIMLEELLKIKNYIQHYSLKDEISISVLIRVILSKWSRLTIPFFGEPLAGLQVMGFLESRALDFEHVILVSCNESHLPGSEFDGSLIPSDIKKHYKLPGTSEKDAMYSYYFYRSIQRAKKIELIYSSSGTSKIGSAEPSRFIYQIEKELSNSNNISVNKKHFDFNYNSFTKPNIIQNEFSIKEISSLFKSGLSASSIKKFLGCPLDFYYKYVIKLQEEEKIEEDIENSTWGNILHLTLEKLFKEKQIINKAALKEIKSNSTAFLDKEFAAIFPDGRYKDGHNALMYHQAIKCLEALLKNEEKNIAENGDYKILGIEKKVECILEADYKGKKIEFKVKAKIDRIDETKDGIRIVDYKSGFISKSDVSLKTFKSFSTQSYSLQLMLYAYLYNKECAETNLKSSILSLKNPKAKFINLTFNNNDSLNEELFLKFENYLIEFAQNLIQDDLEFKHDTKSKYCMMC